MGLSEGSMRQIRYVVASSLDGFIASPNGEVDWILMDPEIDFSALFRQFDTLLVGRKTFDGMRNSGNASLMPGMKVVVVSRTLAQADHSDVLVISDPKARLSAMRVEAGKDIWLFGGGELFRHLAQNQLVDTVEVSVMPVLLGSGVPLLPPSADRVSLNLQSQKAYKSGIVILVYRIRAGPLSSPVDLTR